MDDINSPDSFDAEYVGQLRQEAGKYRTKAKQLESELEGYKGLEAQINTARVENELIRRGVSAEASWISLEDGQAPAEAVDNFLAKYPMFVAGEVNTDEQAKVEPLQAPQAIPPKPTNVQGNAWQKQGLDSIKEDPVARKNLTDHYRGLLNQSE